MPKISIWFREDSADVTTLGQDFFETLGCDHSLRYAQQHTEISANTKVSLYGISAKVPSPLIQKKEWICYVEQRGDFEMFFVGDFLWVIMFNGAFKRQLLPKFFESAEVCCLGRCFPEKNIDFLRHFTALKHLRIAGCSSLIDIFGLKHCNMLQTLKITGCRSFLNLDPIKEITTLRDLMIAMLPSLEDISPISSLSSLVSLTIGSCQKIKSLEPVSKLRNLQVAKIHGFGNCLSYLNPITLTELALDEPLPEQAQLNLAECSNLQTFKIQSRKPRTVGQNLTSLGNFHDLENLQSLSFHSIDPTPCIHELSNLSSLRRLFIDVPMITLNLDFLSPLKNLRELDLSVSTLENLDPLENNIRLHSLSLCSRPDSASFGLEPLENLTSLKSLRISECPVTDLSPIARLNNLKKLAIINCNLIKNISVLAKLSSLNRFEFINGTISPDLNIFKNNADLQYLDLSNSIPPKDIEPISNLKQLRSLNLSQPDNSQLRGRYEKPSQFRIKEKSTLAGFRDLSPLSGLCNLAYINFNNCNLISDVSPLGSLKNLLALELNNCIRIRSIESLRGLKFLRDVNENSSHPAEFYEMMAFNSSLRSDRAYILENSSTWMREAVAWQDGPLPMQGRFAATLGEAFSLLGESPIDTAYVEFINSRADFSSAPWKAWFGGTLKESGFDLYRQRVERVPIASMLPGAIGGACATLPHEENAEWSREWLAELEKARLSDAKALLSVAPEICLAHARLGQTEALGRWLVQFTDPSDLAALDPIHAALAGFQLRNQNLPAAENHIFAIQSPKLRDPVLVDLVSAIAESDPERASAKLLLIETSAMRSDLAKRLAANPGASETTLQRLAVAMGDSPKDLADLIKAIPDPANKTFIETLSSKLQPGRSATLRKIAEEFTQEAERYIAEASGNS
jgi:Leucine-rich repeat (LRR) protein